MKNRLKQITAKKNSDGFSLTELMITISIVGILSTAAIPSYVGQLCRTDSSETESIIGSIKAIVSAYIDETGVFPETWDELSSITAIMTTNGPASGSLSEPITLPRGTYTLAIDGPVDSAYEILAERTDGCENRSIKACLNVSTGASDLRVGGGDIDTQEAICS